MMNKVQPPFFPEPLEPLKPYSANMVLAMQKHVPPNRECQREQMDHKKTQWKKPVRGESHRRERNGVIPCDVLLRPNPAVRQHLRRILRMVTADMNVVQLGDASGVSENPVKQRLDK